MKFLVHTHISHNKKKDKNHYRSRNSLLLPQEMPRSTPKGPERSCSLTAANGHCPVAARAWQVLSTGTCAWPGSTQGFQVQDPIMFSRGIMDISQRTCVILLPQTAFWGTLKENINSREKLKTTEFIESSNLLQWMGATRIESISRPCMGHPHESHPKFTFVLPHYQLHHLMFPE